MRSFVSAAIVLLFLASAVYAQQSVEAIRLLDNAAVSDFDCFLYPTANADEVFQIKDNVLYVTGDPKGYLATKKSYKNFILTSEFRYPDPKIETNSGFLVRIGKQPEKTFLPRCVEIQLMTQDCGTLYSFHDFKMSGNKEFFKFFPEHITAGNCCSLVKFKDARNYQPLAWNTVEILCNENLILIKINGQLVNWAEMSETAAGPVAFQSEGGPAEFRNTVLTVLP